jgi:hypothetical protein
MYLKGGKKVADYLGNSGTIISSVAYFWVLFLPEVSDLDLKPITQKQ